MADDEIRLRAELDGSLERDAEGAAEAVDDLHDKAQQTAIQLQIMGAAARGASRDLDSLDRSASDAADDQKKLTREQRKATKATDEQTSAFDRMQKLLGKFAHKGGIAGALQVYKVPALVTALTVLGSAASALGAGGVAAVAGLAPLGALIAGYPALLFAGVQAFGAFKFATKGVGEAVKALVEGDASKFGPLLHELTPAARDFAREVASLVKGPLKRLQNTVASNLFPGLTKGLQNAKTILPVVRDNLGDTARVMGRLAKRAGEAMNTPLFKQQLGRIMHANNTFLWDAGNAAGSLGGALLNVVDAFRPVTVEMGQAARRGAEYVQRATDAGRETGKLSSFFQRAWHLAQDVTGVITDLSVALFNVGAASQDVSKWMGGGIADLVSSFRDWTESASGQVQIKQWFQDSLPVLRETAKLIRDLAVQLGGLATRGDVAPLIKKIRTELLPQIASFSQGVTDTFAPAIIDAVTAFVKFNNVLSYSPVATILQVMADVANVFLDVVLALPGPLKALVSGIIALNFALRLGALAGGKVLGAFKPMNDAIKGMRADALTGTDGMNRMQRAGFHLANQMTYVKNSVKAAKGDLSGIRGITAQAKGGFQAMGQVGKNAMTGIKGAAGGLTSALGGPWGIAIMGAVTIVGMLASAHAKAKARVEELSGTLDEQTGALTRNTRESVVNNLEKEGMLQKARELGISTQDVVGYVMQEEGAIKRVTTTLKGYHGDTEDALKGNFQFGIALGGNQRKALDLAQALGKESGALRDSQVSTRRKAEAMGDAGRKTRQATNNVNAAVKAEDQLAGGASRAANKLRGQATQTQRVIDKTYELQSAFAENQRTLIGYYQTVDDATKELKKGAHTLDIHTQAGRDNRSAMIDVAEAAAGVKNEAKRQIALRDARKFIIEWGKAAGWSDEKARNYANHLIDVRVEANKVPKNTTVNFNANIDSAQERLRDLKANIDNITARSYNIDMRINAPNRRYGGPVDKMTRYTVGEVGPELLVTRSGTEIIGRHGQETRTFPEAGVVLPNEVYRAAQAGAGSAVQGASAAPATHTSRTEQPREQMPQVHVHFHGDRAPSQAEARRAAKAAFDEFTRNWRERHIAWSG